MNQIKRYARAVERRLCWGLCRLLPVKKNKVVLSSFYGRGYGADPKYIAEALLRTGEKLDLVWMVKDDGEAKNLPEGIRPCTVGSMRQVFELSTARVWVDNCRNPAMLKRRSQTYFHTWHGFSIKKIEHDVADKLSAAYVKSAIRDSRHMDYAISCSSFMTEIFQSAFWYDGPVLQWGEARNDFFFEQSEALAPLRERICKELSIPSDTRLVLYAPTFRADGSLEPYSIDYELLIAACEKRFGGRFTVLVRLHPNIVKQSDALGLNGTTVINASHYVDAQELLAVSDIVITDYSSIVVDFALSGKPGFLFATDFEEYKKDRDVYIPLEEMPFALSFDNDALEQAILTFDGAAYAERLEAFWDRVGMCREGKSGDLLARLIVEICKDQRSGFEKQYLR